MGKPSRLAWIYTIVEHNRVSWARLGMSHDNLYNRIMVTIVVYSCDSHVWRWIQELIVLPFANYNNETTSSLYELLFCDPHNENSSRRIIHNASRLCLESYSGVLAISCQRRNLLVLAGSLLLEGGRSRYLSRWS